MTNADGAYNFKAMLVDLTTEGAKMTEVLTEEEPHVIVY